MGQGLLLNITHNILCVRRAFGPAARNRGVVSSEALNQTGPYLAEPRVIRAGPILSNIPGEHALGKYRIYSFIGGVISRLWSRVNWSTPISRELTPSCFLYVNCRTHSLRIIENTRPGDARIEQLQLNAPWREAPGGDWVPLNHNSSPQKSRQANLRPALITLLLPISVLMSSSVFALIIGVDQYKSSKIWNLASCVDDALKMKRWLMNDLDVPRDHICMLVDSKATKGAIEDAFMSHLVNNPSIQTGDSIIIYFAGHGSSAVAPDGWQNGRPLHVDILCPYDHGTRVRGNRVPGLTDWSMQAMIHELSEAKGDNITLMLDCSFSPVRSRSGTGTRINTRWAPSATKLTSDDLYAGLWRGAGRKVSLSGHGFYQEAASSHMTILACRQGEGAAEDKEGGRFTMAFLKAKDTKSFHETSYDKLLGDLAIHGGEQHPACVGKNKDRILFHGTPFKPDNCYVPALFVDKEVRIAAGAIHGVVESTEFSLHKHNVHGSLNPVLATLQVSAVHSTWSLAKIKSQSPISITEGWVRVTRWNNRTPFKVHLKKTCLSLQRWWKLRRKLPEEPQREATPGGCSVVRVSKAKQAHISVQNHPDGLSIQRHDSLISDNCPQIVQVDTRHALDDVKAIDAAANFHLHLHRKNSKAPLCKRVAMRLHRLDGESWSPVEENLLEDGKAMLTLDDSTLYAVSLENASDVDLWPYLFWMDATGYAIRPVFLPDPAAAPPLKNGGQLTIGTGNIGSEALAFTLNDGEPYNSGFLKLFLSTAYAPMGLVEQGSPTSVPQPTEPPPAPSMSPSLSTAGAEKAEMPSKELWDAVMACVTIVRGGVKSM